MHRDDAKRLITALIRRRHNDALRIKRLKSRLNDADQYTLIRSSIDLKVPQELQGPFTWSGLLKAAKKFKQYAIKNGYSNGGRLEYHTRSKSGVSRDFLNNGEY